MSEPGKQVDKAALASRAAEWALGQPFNNVLLLCILGVLTWLGHYGITKAVPAHLQMIQEGYREIEESHRQERERTMDTFERWLRADAIPPAAPQ